MYTDKREQLPAGVSLEEYAKDILRRMPTSTLTHRETWALKEYLKPVHFGVDPGAPDGDYSVKWVFKNGEMHMHEITYTEPEHA